METRKRLHAEETEVLYPKKRAAIDSNGTPSHLNGLTHPDEPKDGDNLELFRKEAIFRRMKHYSRENERSQLTIAELERRKTTCEAGMAAMEACWSQLIHVIRSLVKLEELPPVDEGTRTMFEIVTDTFEDSHRSLALAEALKSKFAATEKLVSAFVQLSSQRSDLQNELCFKCQKAQSECFALRSEVTLLRSQLSETVSQRDKCVADLIVAESRFDRLQSKTIPAAQASPNINGVQDHESPDEKVDEVEEMKRDKPPSPSPDRVSSPILSAVETEALEDAIKVHEEENVRLCARIDSLQEQVLNFEKQQVAPSEEYISQSPYYKILLEHASKLEHDVKRSEEELQKVSRELEDLHTQQKDSGDAMRVIKESEINEFTAKLKKRDGENVRLREHRDQLMAELTERKHTESVKTHSTQELKTLADSRSERILILQSELRRLRAQMAVDIRDADLMKFILNMTTEDASYVADLKARLAVSEAKVAAFEQSLSKLRQDNPIVAQHIEAESQARQQLIETTNRLEAYQNVYGQSSTLPPDVQELSEQLQQKELELEKLRLQDLRHVEAEISLYTELDKLSAAWEALDRQVKSKIFDLTSMEERLSKSALDKAKSENKFYSAMRDKEALESERKNLMRDVEKQAKVVEKLMSSERNLQSQLGDRDRTLQLFKKTADTYREKLEDLTSEKLDWQIRAEGEAKRVAEVTFKWSEQTRLSEKLKSDISRLDTVLVKSNKEVEKQSKLKAAHSAPSSVKEAQLQGELNKCMSILKCSTCKLNMRNTVITKCMHSFCKQCVDARISTRQRKCPACNLPFAQSDVQQLYFQ